MPEDQNTESAAPEARPLPGKLGERQMDRQELLTENVRGRMVGMLSVLTVLCLCGFFFTLWLVQKDAAKTGGDAASLVLIHEHKLAYILSWFFLAIGSLLVAPVLLHIALAARSRSTAVPKVMQVMAIAGPAIVAIVLPLFTITQVAASNDFWDGGVHTLAAAKDALDNTGVHLTTIFYQVAQLFLAVAWVMVGVYGMRVGLLSKLVGFVAIAIAAANVLAPPLAAVLQVFWIGALAIMLLGRLDQRPPAWALGRPVPWQEVNADPIAMRREADAAAEALEAEPTPGDVLKS